MKYLCIICVKSQSKGYSTCVDVITPQEVEDRAIIFYKMYSKACGNIGASLSETGVIFFHLEPLELKRTAE